MNVDQEPGSRRNFVIAAVFVALAGTLLFARVFGLSLVLSQDDFWLNPRNDMITMLMGHELLQRAPWGWPLTIVEGFRDEPFSIVYTDSIPLFSLILKATGLGQVFNPLGLFLFLSFVLQPVAMIALLRAFDVRRLSLLVAGGLIALLMPAWTARQFGHIALGGHWLLLLAAALAVLTARSGLTWARVAGFIGLAALATSIHAYHLIPIAACFAAALLADLLQSGVGRLPRVLAAGGGALIGVGVTAWALGYGVGQGPSEGAAAMGYYGMNGMGPFLPEGSRLFGQVWDGAWFKPSLPPPSQAFEGLQYLGAGGVILAFAAAAAALWRLGDKGWTWEDVRRWGPLTAAAVVLTLWSVGPIVYLGAVPVFEAPRPDGIIGDLLGYFRAHGRFFWIVGYLILAVGLIALGRMPSKAVIPALTAILLLQYFDTAPLRGGLRANFAAAEPSYLPEGLQTGAPLKGRRLHFYPTYFCTSDGADQRALLQLNLLAERQGGATNSLYTARTSDPFCGAPSTRTSRDAAAGDPTITVVLGSNLAKGGYLHAVAQRTDCHRFSRGVMCGVGLSGLSGFSPVAVGDLTDLEPGVVMRTRYDQGLSPPSLGIGWSRPEPGAQGIWSDGRSATLLLDYKASAPPRRLVIRALGFSDAPRRPQRLIVRVGGREIGRTLVGVDAFADYAFDAATLPAVGPVTLTFDLPDARSSAADPRQLGISLSRIELRD